MIAPRDLRRVLLLLVACLFANDCFGTEALFYRVSRNYGHEGVLGQAYRREFETRMFTHSTWQQRLLCIPYDPDIDETVEVYTRPDGSRWCSHARAEPSLSRSIGVGIRYPAEFNLTKELARTRIKTCEVALPPQVAQEIELLWRAMLPGPRREPQRSGTERVIFIHPPAFVGFVRRGELVQTGRLAMVAYDTRAYRDFVGIVDDLIAACDRRVSASDPVFQRLARNMRLLRLRL